MDIGLFNKAPALGSVEYHHFAVDHLRLLLDWRVADHDRHFASISIVVAGAGVLGQTMHFQVELNILEGTGVAQIDLDTAAFIGMFNLILQCRQKLVLAGFSASDMAGRRHQG